MGGSLPTRGRCGKLAQMRRTGREGLYSRVRQGERLKRQRSRARRQAADRREAQA